MLDLNQITLSQNIYVKKINEFLKQCKICPKGSNNTNIIDQISGINYFISNEADQFFALVEDCRKHDICLHFAERQWYRNMEEDIIHSCIELDFDIYQEEEKRQLKKSDYVELSTNLFSLLREIVNIENDVFIAIMRKKKLYKTNHNDYGICFKDGIHIRIFVKISKEIKKYYINQIKEKGILNNLNIKIYGSNSDILDVNSAHFPVMLLGSAKRDSQIPYEFYHLIQCCKKNDSYIIKLKQIDTNKYNLCHEFSIHFEVSGGFIKKPIVNPVEKITPFLKNISERTEGEYINYDDVKNVINMVNDLCNRDHEASYIRDCLDCISVERLKKYESWLEIITLIACHNPEYKILAIYASQRYPQSWSKNGENSLNKIWSWALMQKTNRRIQTLFYWAKEDDPEKYKNIQDRNLFKKIYEFITSFAGKLNHYQYSQLLKIVFPNQFAYDPENGKDFWFEFIFSKNNDRYSLYKWRCSSYAIELDHYVTNKLPEYLDKVMLYIKDMKEKNAENAEIIRYCTELEKNINKNKYNLGQNGTIVSILKRCESAFYRKGFHSILDSDQYSTGVINGILKMYPKTELIQSYNDLYVSRCVNASYIPYDPEDESIKKLETWIRMLFHNDQDAYDFILYYLASTLDGRKKKPILFIWLGEGSNGKTFLLELHIHLLRNVMNYGYSYKFNVSLITQGRTGKGPDSETASFKGSRFNYCSETEEGEILFMSRIKELLSDTISCNEKYKTQEMFEIFAQFVIASNHDPRISGSDYGTWRRILVYSFKMKFKPDPDPNNEFEKKEDTKLLNEITKDPQFLQAYLSILIKYYEELRDKYHYDLDSIPKPTIDKETKDYRHRQDIFTYYVETYIIKDENAEDIMLDVLITRYITWYTHNISEKNYPARLDVKQKFLHSYLQKSMIQINNNWKLTKHKLLDI
ncbi:MAG: DUF5906 domain-containing protein [Nitrososphaerota archaeon]